MTNAFSRLKGALEVWSFQYNCYEAVHPWTPFCSDSALEIGMTVFGEAIKLYTPLYLFSQFMQRRFDFDSFKNTSQSILRSTTFISANAFFALFFFCSSQYVTGKFYYYAVAYIPGFLASSMAVMIEKPSRRSSLAFYVANVASEALFRIYVARGYLRPINHGQVYIFTLAIATIMLLAKRHGFEDDPLSAAIRLIVGPEEANKRQRRRHCDAQDLIILEGKGASSSSSILTDDCQKLVCSELKDKDDCLAKSTSKYYKIGEKLILIQRLNRQVNWIKSLVFSRHRLCPHPGSSCLFYTSKAASRALLIGYGAQLCLKLLTKVPTLIKDPSLALKIATDSNTLRLGLFLSCFSGLYKATNCLLRHSLDNSAPVNCFLAALVAGPSLLIYPSPTVALYVLWKCLEALFHEAVRNNIIRRKNLFIVVLYGLATSQLFYSALMDPRYMKKSYMAFLDRISHHKLHMVNRSVLDVFGTEASSGYEEFFPDLHPKFMSRAFLSSIWIWMIEQKFARYAWQ